MPSKRPRLPEPALAKRRVERSAGLVTILDRPKRPRSDPKRQATSARSGELIGHRSWTVLQGDARKERQCLLLAIGERTRKSFISCIERLHRSAPSIFQEL